MQLLGPTHRLRLSSYGAPSWLFGMVALRSADFALPDPRLSRNVHRRQDSGAGHKILPNLRTSFRQNRPADGGITGRPSTCRGERHLGPKRLTSPSPQAFRAPVSTPKSDDRHAQLPAENPRPYRRQTSDMGNSSPDGRLTQGPQTHGCRGLSWPGILRSSLPPCRCTRSRLQVPP
jgi:hypothetical protein